MVPGILSYLHPFSYSYSSFVSIFVAARLAHSIFFLLVASVLSSVYVWPLVAMTSSVAIVEWAMNRMHGK